MYKMMNKKAEVTRRQDLEPGGCSLFKSYYPKVRMNRDSSVGIATGYWLDDLRFGVRVPVASRIFYSPRRPDRVWGPHGLLSNGQRGLFPRESTGQGIKLTTRFPTIAELKR
jgi:hypothetical protein